MSTKLPEYQEPKNYTEREWIKASEESDIEADSEEVRYRVWLNRLAPETRKAVIDQNHRGSGSLNHLA